MHSYHEDERLRARPFRGRPASRSRNVPFLFAAIITASLTLHAGGARSADRLADSPAATAPGSDTGTKLETVTIQAARARKELRRRVSRFVFSVVVSHMNDSLPRWNEPICPLIAGLPRAQGEYILARISQVATAAHAPLAGEHCKPNLFVIATPYPQALLEKWWARDTRMYNICSGVGGVETFIHSKSPIRVWYNTMPGIKLPIQLDAPSLGLKLGPTSRCISAGEGGTRLAQAVLELSQTFIVIDTDQTSGLTIGQLADYVSMVGLAQIQPHARPGAPSILSLFEDERDPPKSMSAWDRALLYALYQTGQSNPLQVSLIERRMVSRIAPAR